MSASGGALPRAAASSAAAGTSSAYVCVACGAPMLERACRARCPRCGYFEDCENGLTPPPVERPGRAPGVGAKEGLT